MAHMEPGSLQLKVTLEGMPDLNTVLTDEVRFYNPETEEYETREKTLGDLVAEKMVDKLMADDPWRGLRKSINELREKIVREKVEPVIEAALDGPIQLTNQYGEPTGRTGTLREMVVLEATRQLTRPQRGTSGSETILSKAIRETVNTTLTKELKEAADAGKTALVAAIRAQAVKVLTDAVVKEAGL